MSGDAHLRVSVINGYSAHLSDVCLQRVLAHPDVEYVEVCSALYNSTPATGGTHKTIGGRNCFNQACVGFVSL